MKKHAFDSVCVALVAVLLSAGASLAQEGKPEFSIAIHGPESAKVGTYIVVDILVTNISNHVIAFDDGDFPTLGEANFHVDLFDGRGDLAPRTSYGKAVRGEKPSPGEPLIVLTGHYIERSLKPGEALKESVTLSGPHEFGLYDMKPGVYTVVVWRPDFQAGHATSNSKPEDSDLSKPVAPHSEATANPVAPKPKAIAKSNTITLTVVLE